MKFSWSYIQMNQQVNTVKPLRAEIVFLADNLAIAISTVLICLAADKTRFPLYFYCRVAVVVSSANMELELVRQCVDRALVLDDRVSKFSVQLGEWPGDMAKLLDILSREDVR